MRARPKMVFEGFLRSSDLHCLNLEHEDRMMMADVSVV